MKKSWLKFGLATVWLLCFFRWEETCWREPMDQVAIDVEVIGDHLYCKIDARRRSHMQSLNEEIIFTLFEADGQSLREHATKIEWSQKFMGEGHQISSEAERLARLSGRLTKPALILHGVTY